MIAKKRKRKKEGSFFQVLMTLFFFSMAGFLIFSNLRLAKEIENLVREKERLENKVEILKEKKEALEGKISRAQTEDFLEERLRERGYQRPGEKQIVVLPPEGKKNFFQIFLEMIKNFGRE